MFSAISAIRVNLSLPVSRQGIPRTQHAKVLLLQSRFFSQQGALLDPDPEMVDTRNAPSDFDLSSAVVYKDFATEEEAASLAKDLKACLRRCVVMAKNNA